MKKQLILGMVTLLVAIPGFSQIKAQDKKEIPLTPRNINHLPSANYQGWQLKPDLYEPKGFQGVLLPKAQYEKPTWVNLNTLQNNMPRYRPQVNQKIKVAKPNSGIKYQ